MTSCRFSRKIRFGHSTITLCDDLARAADCISQPQVGEEQDGL